MTDLSSGISDEIPRRGMISQIATVIFLGIPMTIGLVSALAVYCTYTYVSFALFPKPQALNLLATNDESVDSFTASLQSFAQIHGVPQNPEIPVSADELERTLTSRD